jgi:hypothetical protein
MRARATILGLGLLTLGAFLLAPPVATAKTRLGFWAGESVPGTDYKKPSTYWKPRSIRVYKPRLWETLSRDRMSLYFNLRFRSDFGPLPKGRHRHHEALRVLREANRYRIPVWGWVLIPFSAGYWAWEGAAEEEMRAVQSLVHWKAKNHVHLKGVVIDPEPPVGTPYGQTAAILRGGGAALNLIFRHNLNPAAQCAAWSGYSDIVAWAHTHHVRIAAAPTPTALDDLGDGRLALQDASQFVLPRAGWNKVFFQAYRSIFYYYRRHDPGPALVASYLLSARSHFGRAGEVSIGSAGRTGYRKLGQLVHDVRLAATLGARELPIYSLERTLHAYGGLGALEQLAWAAHHPFKRKKQAEAAAVKRAAVSVHTALARTDSYAAVATSSIAAESGATAIANPWPEACGS